MLNSISYTLSHKADRRFPKAYILESKLIHSLLSLPFQISLTLSLYLNPLFPLSLSVPLCLSLSLLFLAGSVVMVTG